MVRAPGGPRWDRLRQAVAATEPAAMVGHVVSVIGLTILSRGPAAGLGQLCTIRLPGRTPASEPALAPRAAGAGELVAEVVGFRDGLLVLMPIGDMAGIRPGCEVSTSGQPPAVPVSNQLVGRVVDGLGRPIDGRPAPPPEALVPVHRPAPPPLGRALIREPLGTGVRAIDGLVTCGKGQRLGIFAGSGVGKSTLLGMIARAAEADLTVVAMIGERGREVREFVERELGEAGMAKAIVVAATSDQPALVRRNGAFVATAIAEHFRDQGRDVVLIMDSLTRLCMAQREIGLASGEPPATRGYPPSVFGLLPRLLERAGRAERGSITGFYSVLVEGDDMNEPITDAVRGILDGHLVLSRRLAALNHFPPIDVLESVSRAMPAVTTAAHRHAAGRFRRALATLREAQDLIDIGAYQPGANPAIDAARAKEGEMLAYLQQEVDALCPLSEAVARLAAIWEGDA